MRFTDSAGHRFTAFITDTAGGQLADLETRHRAHARVEDRIRCGKSTGLRNMPCKSWADNQVWLELSLTAADLITWAQALCFTDELARCFNLLAAAVNIGRMAMLGLRSTGTGWVTATA